MKVKYVASFGDSWTYGDELQNPDLESFTSIIARHYKATPHNCGEKGSSQTASRNLFQRYLYEHNDTIHETLFLIGLTGSYRWSWINGRIPEQIYPDRLVFNSHIDSTNDQLEGEWQQLKKLHTMMVQSNYTDKMNHYESLLFFDGIACRNNLKLVQFNYFDTYNIDFLDVPTHIIINPLNRIIGKTMRAPGGHPNKLGHQLIAEKLLEKIKDMYD